MADTKFKRLILNIKDMSNATLAVRAARVVVDPGTPHEGRN